MKHASFLSILVAALTLMPLQACSAFDGPISGVVVDATSGAPVADAIVVVRWHASRINSSSCNHVATARTDANGRYKVEAWVKPWALGDLFEHSTGIDARAYKPGYETEDTVSSLTKITITPFKGTKDEYFDRVLASRGWGCAQAGVSRKSMRQLYIAVAREAAELAETKNQRRLASFLENQIDDPLDEELKSSK